MYKRQVYSSCVRSCLLHSSETWPVKRENELALLRAEMRMVMDLWLKVLDLELDQREFGRK